MRANYVFGVKNERTGYDVRSEVPFVLCVSVLLTVWCFFLVDLMLGNFVLRSV